MYIHVFSCHMFPPLSQNWSGIRAWTKLFSCSSSDFLAMYLSTWLSGRKGSLSPPHCLIYSFDKLILSSKGLRLYITNLHCFKLMNLPSIKDQWHVTCTETSNH